MKGNHPAEQEELAKLWKLSGQYQAGYTPDEARGLERLKARMAAAKEGEQGSPAVQPRGLRLPAAKAWAAAAALALALAAALWVWQPQGQAPDMAIHTAGSRTETLHLSDGSQIVLNNHARISYPKGNIAGKQRLTQLSGEAFFSVASDAARPFVVSTSQGDVEVLGTQFNVRAVPGEDFTEVEVSEGQVALTAKASGQRMVLAANERARSYADGRIEKVPAPDLYAQAWRTGVLDMKGSTPAAYAQALTRFMDWDVSLQGDIPGTQCPITMTIQKDYSVAEVAEALKLAFNIELSQQPDGRFLLDVSKCR